MRLTRKKGSGLLAALFAYGAPPPAVDPDQRARAARDEAERWVVVHFPRLRSALARLHRDQPSPFAGIEQPDALRAPLALATLLERLRKLGPPDSDPVLQTLAHRGLDHDEIVRLGALVERAHAIHPEDDPPLRDPRTAERVALHRWYTDWSTTARSLIRRKDHLILLGLSARRREGAEEEVTDNGADDAEP